MRTTFARFRCVRLPRAALVGTNWADVGVLGNVWVQAIARLESNPFWLDVVPRVWIT